MTFSLVGTDVSSSAVGSTSTASVTWPTVASGDLALLFWVLISTANPTDPADFTVQGSVNTPNGTGELRCVYKVCTGSESGTITVSDDAGTQDKVTASLAVYRGVSTTSPINAFQTLPGNTLGTSLPCPAATSTAAGVMAVTVLGSRVTTGPTSLTSASPFTSRTFAPSPAFTGGGSSAVGLADNLTPYGASGTVITPPNWTSNFSYTNNAWATMTVLLTPAPVATGARPQLVRRQAVKRASFY